MAVTLSSDRIEAAVPTTSIAKLLSECLEERYPAVLHDAPSGSARRIVLDCGGVGSVSSEDLSELIRFHSRLRRQAATLVLTNVPEPVARIFSITRLNRLFTVIEAPPSAP